MPETNFVSIEELKFDENGLIPAVVVDSEASFPPSLSTASRRRS